MTIKGEHKLTMAVVNNTEAAWTRGHLRTIVPPFPLAS